MFLISIGLCFGIMGIMLGGNYFVDYSTILAQKIRISTAFVGLTIVAIGTSTPEIVVSILAAIKGHQEIAIANAIGSNITNIGLVLGFCLCISSLPIQSQTLKKDLPWLTFITVIVGLLFIGSFFGYWQSLILLILLVFSFYFMFRWKNNQSSIQQNQNISDKSDTKYKNPFIKHSLTKILLMLSGSLLLLISSAQLLIWSAINIAKHFGVSEWFIGITVIAIGTSLPELVASVIAILKKEYDLMLGSIIGSNIFNLLIVLPMAGLFSPGTLPKVLLIRDYPAMLIMTALCLIAAIMNRKKFNQLTGIVFLTCYAVYLWTLHQ